MRVASDRGGRACEQKRASPALLREHGVPQVRVAPACGHSMLMPHQPPSAPVLGCPAAAITTPHQWPLHAVAATSLHAPPRPRSSTPPAHHPCPPLYYRPMHTCCACQACCPKPQAVKAVKASQPALQPTCVDSTCFADIPRPCGAFGWHNFRRRSYLRASATCPRPSSLSRRWMTPATRSSTFPSTRRP